MMMAGGAAAPVSGRMESAQSRGRRCGGSAWEEAVAASSSPRRPLRQSKESPFEYLA